MATEMLDAGQHAAADRAGLPRGIRQRGFPLGPLAYAPNYQRVDTGPRHRGPGAIAVGVVSEVADRPRRLRAYHPATGDLRPVNPTLDTLTPVVAVADLTAEPDRAEFHTLSCGLAKQATKQFGVEHPQLVLDPRSGTPDPGSSSLVSVNPFRCGVDASASAPDRRGGTQAS